MPRPSHNDIQQAFRLAAFVLGDRQAARAATLEAVDRLEVSARAQRKRRYYRPTGRSAHKKPYRSKVTVSERNLLQRLVYVTCEPFERAQEAQTQGGPDDHRMAVRFIKELVRQTVKRNAFYVTLGVTRLLHDYTTHDAMELYGVLADDPERTPDETYWRARRLALLRELQARFGDRIRVAANRRGEKRFVSRSPNDDDDALVRQCLERFTPWDSACGIPSEFDPRRDLLPAFHSPNDDPDAGHKSEMNRMHAILHPSCLATLSRALGLESPAQHVTLPVFAVDARPPTSRPDEPAPLDRRELRAFKRALRVREEARKRLIPAALSVRVDGQTRGGIECRPGAHGRLPLHAHDELVELVGKGDHGDQGDQGDIVLATLMPSLVPSSLPLRVNLPKGKILELEVGGSTENRTLAWRCAQSPWWQMGLLRPGAPPVHLPRRLGWSALAASALGVALALTWQLPDRETGPSARREVPGHAVSTTRSPGTAPPLTRPSVAGIADVDGVTRIWVAPITDDLGGQRLHRALVRALEAHAGITVTAQPEQADIALKALLEMPGTLGLVRADGKILWHAALPPGTPAEAARQLAARLAHDRQSPVSTNPAQ